MIIAGYILLGISLLLLLCMLSMPASTVVILSFLLGLTIMFVVPGIVLLSVGTAIKRRRENKPVQTRNANEKIYVCEECGYQVFPDFKLCPKCGTELSFEQDKGKFCGMCGKELTDEHVFCPYCGTKR